MAYSMTTEQIEVYLKEVHEYNLRAEEENKTGVKDDLFWMGESIESLYKMCLKYDHDDPDHTLNDNEQLKTTRVIRSNRMIEKYFLKLYNTEYVFLSGVYIPLQGLIVNTTTFNSYLAKSSGEGYNEVQKSYLLSAGHPLSHQNMFIPKISDYVPNPINTSKSYRLVTL